MRIEIEVRYSGPSTSLFAGSPEKADVEITIEPLQNSEVSAKAQRKMVRTAAICATELAKALKNPSAGSGNATEIPTEETGTPPPNHLH